MSNYRRQAITLALMFLFIVPAFAAEKTKVNPAQNQQQSKADELADHIFWREAKTVGDLKQFTPMVETYVQNLKPDNELGQVPSSDKYFLGRLVMKNGIEDISFEKQSRRLPGRILDSLNNFMKMNYLPVGFMQLVYIPAFDKQHYDLKYLHQEFLGEVRTLVFDVSPKPKQKGPHFLGRIWVEDQDQTIVRFNGTYQPQNQMHYYFHFDTWRINVRPGIWAPAFIYTEESDAKYILFRKLAMKGQTRLWGYNLKPPSTGDEFTSVQVDAARDVSDQSDTGPNSFNPVESEHRWEREAEDHVLDRLQRAGLLAPEGDVSKVLETVIRNLEITNNLDIQPQVRARVLLTEPLESFNVGHTIVVSRGLLDVLPDEASLAMVLSHELGHIALGHRLDTKYAFGDRVLFPDQESLRRIQIAHTAAEDEAADQKAIELLKNSPYKDKLSNAGLFLRALESRSGELPALITPQFGNRMAKGNSVLRMSALLESAPALKPGDVQQLAALPLGSRIKLDPWDDHVELQKNKPVPLLSARDKMAFEVTPMIPYLVRYRTADQVAQAGAAQKQ